MQCIVIVVRHQKLPVVIVSSDTRSYSPKALTYAALSVRPTAIRAVRRETSSSDGFLRFKLAGAPRSESIRERRRVRQRGSQRPAGLACILCKTFEAALVARQRAYWPWPAALPVGSHRLVGHAHGSQAKHPKEHKKIKLRSISSYIPFPIATHVSCRASTIMLINFDYESSVWRAVEWWYRIPEPPIRTRDPKKPMQVIAVGFGRSGTESLQQALSELGFDHCYHGWDMLFEEPTDNQAWIRLAQKKWHSKTGDCHITAAEFDKIIGHAVAIVDIPASCFSAELIEAYPEAKVICNQRRDSKKWRQSAIKNLVEAVNEQYWLWFLTWWDAELFWMWTSFERYLQLRLYRCRDWGLRSGVADQGIWVFREHLNAVRGLLYSRGEQHRFLDWYLDEGWEPLCKFLDKPVPDKPFPNANDANGFQGRVDAIMQRRGVRAMRNFGVFVVSISVVVLGAMYC